MTTVVVTLADQAYFNKCKRTIVDARTRGRWSGDIVLISVGFDVPQSFLDFYSVIQKRVEHIDCSRLLSAYSLHPIRPTHDAREFLKLTQWDKFYVFDDFFLKWDKVVYMDAGLRVLDKICYLSDLPCAGLILAPDDSPAYDAEKRFGGIIETDRNPEVVKILFQEFGLSCLDSRYFLNCIWMYDTNLLHLIRFEELVEYMNKYPISRCNEMTIMNLLFSFKYKVWSAIPEFIETSEGKKRLFGWTECDRDYENLTWRDFCFLKYPSTIDFDCC